MSLLESINNDNLPKHLAIIMDGNGRWAKQKGFLNKLIRFDTFLIAVNYLSAAIKGKAYMGVGRNLGYKKELFTTGNILDQSFLAVKSKKNMSLYEN